MDPPAYPIASVDNALRLLRLVRDRQVVRLSEASEALGVVPSTAHRLLAMLQYHGLVRQDADTRAYLAGPALVEPGHSPSLEALRVRLHPYLEVLAGESGETVHLCVLDGPSLLFVDSVESAKALRTGSRAGVSLPAHCTSAGKVLLAELPPAALAEVLGGEELVALTPDSIATVADLERELAAVRERGYGTNLTESEADVAAVAVALPDLPGLPRAALAISGPASRLGPGAIEPLVALLRRVIDAVERGRGDAPFR